MPAHSGRSRRGWTLVGAISSQTPRVYDFMYRRGAPWEGGPRRELVELVESGRVTTAGPGRRALDLGCGSGSGSVYLASHGFDVVGVDVSAVAIDKAKAAATAAGVAPRFVVGDLMELPAVADGPFDLFLDGGTIDDFAPRRRPAVVDRVESLSRPGSMLITWCFYGWVRDLPIFSFSGPSRRGAPCIEPDELEELFGGGWDLERLSGGVEDGFACFLAIRR